MKDIINKLIDKSISISFAESCTGGALASTLTKVPGVSKIFKGSYVTYSKEQKHKMIGVSLSTIKKYGVVSKETAKEMAIKLRKKIHSDICVSVTGNAGPTTNDDLSNVGQIFVCIIFFKNINEYSLSLIGQREDNINAIVEFVYKEIDKLI